MLRLIRAALIGVAVSAVLGLVAMWWLGRSALHETIPGIHAKTLLSKDRVAQRLPDFIADRDHLAQLPLLADTALAGRDAGPFLDPLLDWSRWEKDTRGTELDAALRTWRQRVGPRPSTLDLPEKIHTALDTALSQKTFGALLGDPPQLDLAGLDFSWMKRLHEFDYWEIDGNSPGTELDPQSEGPNTLVEPFDAKLFVLTRWIQLRILKGLNDGDPQAALQDVRQLAQLLLSTEHLQ